MQSAHQEIPILSVTQLTNAIKHCLELSFPSLWLQGEISNFKLQSSGHLYFSLKDTNAQIAAVMFRSDAAELKIRPKDGMHVIVRGEINVYPPSGKYQLLIREMKLMGLGERLLQLEELKAKLQKKGWFNAEHKKPLPHLPLKIGVVTSPTGAAIQDILNILTRRFSGFHLILNPVKVQGEGAAQEIARAIEQFNQYQLVDVMIVGRGGGSIEDLWAFNEEIVAAAIFNSQIPIISAVGHETDHCIADYVADIRAPTPSAAAEIVIAEKSQQQHHLRQISQRLQQTIKQQIRHSRHRIEAISKLPIFRSPYALLGIWIQRLDYMKQEVDLRIQARISYQSTLLSSREKQLKSLNPLTKINHLKQKLNSWEKILNQTVLHKLRNLKTSLVKYQQLDQSWKRLFLRKKESFENLSSSLCSIDPKNLLTKGYCILFSEKKQSVITSIQEVNKNEAIRLFLHDGQIISTIKNIIPK